MVGVDAVLIGDCGVNQARPVILAKVEIGGSEQDVPNYEIVAKILVGMFAFAGMMQTMV